MLYLSTGEKLSDGARKLIRDDVLHEDSSDTASTISSYRYHLYPLRYGYHLYPPTPKKNFASSPI